MPMQVESPPLRKAAVSIPRSSGSKAAPRTATKRWNDIFNIHICRELSMYFRVYKNKKALQRVIKLSTPAIVRIQQFKLATIVPNE